MAKYIEHEKIWEMLHGIGGCGAKPESWADGWDKAIDAAIEELDKLPAADVQEVKHGKWRQEYRSGREINKGFVSSCCDMWNERQTDYCPNCGAKMDSGKNEK